MSNVQKKPCVFVLNPSAEERAALGASLSKLDVECASFAEEAAGLEKALSERPEVLLCELEGDGFDGARVLSRLADSNANVAFIGLCGRVELQEVLRLFRDGAVDFVKKPYTEPELHAAVQRALEVQRRRAPMYAATEVQEREGDGVPASEVFALVLQRVRKGQIKLPAVPAIITELRQKLVSINCRMDDIVALVQRDQMLATDVLRLATSAVYGNLRGKPDLRTAITRVGFRELLQLVDTVMAHRFFRMQDPSLQGAVAALWRMSLARAYFMRALAEACKLAPPPSPDRAYLCGLLADIGASFLLRVLVELPAGRRPASVDACLAFAAAHHEALGESLLGAWGLDPIVAKVAGTHHRARTTEASPYGALAVVASSLAEKVLGEADRLAHVQHEPSRLHDATLLLGLDEQTVAQVEARVEPILRAALAAVAG